LSACRRAGATDWYRKLETVLETLLQILEGDNAVSVNRSESQSLGQEETDLAATPLLINCEP